MAEASIPVDLLNPGQVFACLGFVEANLSLFGEVEATFDWSASSNVRFRIRSAGDESPVARVLEFLSRAQVFGDAPAGSTTVAAWKSTWGMLRAQQARESYPFPDPTSPATVVCVLERGDQRITIDYWGDATVRDNAKFWGGAGGYPGVALTRDAIELVRQRATEFADDPFALSAPQSSSFRLDWRRDYIPIDAGFSLNKHAGRIESVGYPLVELLGAIGLGHARPARTGRGKLEYDYGVVGRDRSFDFWLPPSILRVALGGHQVPFPMRRFHMSLGWPNKPGQDRAITTVTEEITE